MASSPITSWQIEWEKVEAVRDFIFLDSKALWTVTAAVKLRHLLLGRKAMTNLDNILKKQRHHFADKGLCSQNYGFSSSQVQMWEFDHKEGWAPKNLCFQIVVLEKTLESPWTAGRSNQPILKEISPEYSRTDADAPIFWPRDVKNQCIGKDPDAGKDWRQQEKGVDEDEMVG